MPHLLVRDVMYTEREFVYGAYASGGAVVGIGITFSALATVIVVLRVRLRTSHGGHLDLDDWLIVASLGLQCLFAVELIYTTIITLIKASVISMYRRIFPTSLVNWGVHVLGAMAGMWFIAGEVVSFVQCVPIYKLWRMEIEGKCISAYNIFVGIAIPNIAIDIMILALPLYEVCKLQMDVPKKVGIGGTFLLAGAVIVISGVRLGSGLYFLRDGQNLDMTLAATSLWVWTILEPAMGIICACLPTMRPLINMVIGGLFKKKPIKNSSGPSNFRVNATIGGGPNRPINRSSKIKGGNIVNGSFERLDDSEGGASQTNLWPKGYSSERKTIVSGRRTPSVQSVDIPLTSIGVRHEIVWDENSANTSET
ncbi:uncharacterized protein BCR38DRAFT_388581 [Pseudomassariella vexata]|uniref:Rhodopsin domain-containing protein n=1 Tax=Pseudomassariella vexata TaxID=1141098 RepID=A0A1Y2E8Y4_9PEZI|nr:uncharacterized protein BCR38DRAFT_388581 [Pseudomassariella vexata]ORY67746.1 hypothetical protein BCR38DRAFT_388581 [Pseudomassariella vexata]